MPDRRLQPPPRVTTGGSGDPNASSRGESGRSRRTRKIGSSVLFGVLILGLISVFIILPKWQKDRYAKLAASQQNNTMVPLQPATSPLAETAAPPTMTATPQPEPTPESRSTRAVPVPVSTRGPSQAERDYRRAMTEGLVAIESGRWEDARSALERAAGHKPGAPEVADALARVAAGQRRETISEGIQRALELERAEAWHQAEETYATVLSVDPEAADAISGHERASYRADLDEKLEYHLQNPDRLASPAVLEDASALLEEVRAAGPGGPRLKHQASRLEQLIETASTPIPVTLESDNLTEVLVLRVGRLGTFSRRELSLRPGTYTAVGSRAGFRDIRVRFVVAPGTSVKPVIIRCTDGI